MKEHHVVIEYMCQCAKKRNLEQIRSFDTKEEAEEHSYEWADTLNNTFCGRHGFDSVEVEESYVISVESGSYVEACEI
jgi:hypothetical protein